LAGSVIAAALQCIAPAAYGQGILDADWGAGFSRCEGAQTPLPFKAASLGNDNLSAHGIITCQDAGDAFVYAVDYMNFELSAASAWNSAHVEWFGAAAQRAGAEDRNDWIYDEVRPIKVGLAKDGRRVAIANISFRVPKRTLASARGFGFYVVGGGIFWTIALAEQLEKSEWLAPPYARFAEVKMPAAKPKAPLPLPSRVIRGVPVTEPGWGANFATCAGAKTPIPLKAASPENDNLVANGIITCLDDGEAFLYAIDYMNFSLAPTSKWESAHLEWLGAAAQTGGGAGGNEWLYDEAKPINVQIKAATRRVSVTNLSFRVPKSVVTKARGLGFYVVGGGIMWSLLLL
jgi:hypothetical protein